MTMNQRNILNSTIMTIKNLQHIYHVTKLVFNTNNKLQIKNLPCDKI